MIEFVVLGDPEQAGSKKSMRGRYEYGKPMITDDNPRVKGWMNTIRVEARKEMIRTRARMFEGEAVVLEMTFFLRRPKTVSQAKRPYPIVSPDTTKLLRAAEDGLKGTVWFDDCLVVDQHAYKRYADDRKPCVVIRVYAKE